MKQHSLTLRLALLFALLSVAVLGTVGFGLYQGLETQLVLRDDTALVTPVAFLLVRMGLTPLRRLARQTDSIGMANLNAQLLPHGVPSELSPLIAAFNAMLDRLATGFAQMSQLSADMAHDLRTPIANLLGQTEVALGQKRSVDDYETLLASNFEEFQRLSRMMDNVLFLARCEHPEATIECAPLDVELATGNW